MSGMFERTELNSRNERRQKLVKILFGLMTVLLVLPVLLILTILVIRGGPALSMDFLFTEPTNGMTEGGIMPALVGTIWLVAVALLAKRDTPKSQRAARPSARIRMFSGFTSRCRIRWLWAWASPRAASRMTCRATLPERHALG